MGSSKKPPPPAPTRKPPPPAPTRKPPPPAPQTKAPAPAQKPAVPPPPIAGSRKAPTWVKRGPAPRSTIEVDTAWLLEEAQAIPPSAPVPGSMRPRRDTMEVKLEWLEESPTRKSSAPIKSKKGPPPIPREEPEEVPTKGGRKVPPTLPPDELAKRPSRAVKAVRKGPPPLPREEPDDEPKTRRSKRP